MDYSHKPEIPHGLSVVLDAPAVFRFTAPAAPERHRYAAGLLGLDAARAGDGDVGELLAGALIALMRRAGLPNGLAAVGYGPADVDELVAGTLPQAQRHQALAAPGGRRRPAPALPGVDDALVERRRPAAFRAGERPDCCGRSTAFI